MALFRHSPPVGCPINSNPTSILSELPPPVLGSEPIVLSRHLVEPSFPRAEALLVTEAWQPLASSPAARIEGKRPRVVEHGMLKCPGVATFWIQAEAFPIWLLALDRSFVHTIHLMGGADAKSFISSMKARNCDLSLINLVIGRIGLGRVHYSNLSRPAPQGPRDIVLLSGSLAYVREHARLAVHPTMVLCDVHIRGRVTKFGGSFRWFHLRHSSFGGSTSFKAFLGTNIETFQPELTALRRSISHILDHGVRPAMRQADFPGAVRATRLLHPHDLHVEVLYRTSFTSSGWGSRSLTVSELGIAFGFPSWLRRDGLAESTFPIVPLQILDGCIRGLLPQVTAKQPLPKIEPAPQAVENHKTWLPRLQKFLSHAWIDSSLVTEKAVKHEDASPPTHLWDQRCLLVLPHLAPALSILRTELMIRTAYQLFKEFCGYMSDHYGCSWARDLCLLRSQELHSRVPLNRKRTRGVEEEVSKYVDGELLRDGEVGHDAISRFADANWWSWERGSTLLFWRWAEGDLRRFARDGMDVYITAKLPQHQRPARPPTSEKRPLILQKILKVLKRGYVVIPRSMNYIKSLIDYFDVPKDDDIRMVYNGTSCGLNEVLFAPNFWLPTPKSAGRVLGFGYYMADINLGEMFLNFPLPSVLQRYSGIDVTTFKREVELDEDIPKEKIVARPTLWANWNRCWMGLKPSPYMAVRFYYFGEEFARGDRRAKQNPLRWDRVKLNLPSDPLYNPALPRVMKWNEATNSIAGDILAFVDDLRASGSTPEQAWQISRQVASRFQYLGIQDAPRKRRPPVRTPGAWAGCVFSTSNDSVRQTVAQSKWDRAKAEIMELLGLYLTDEEPWMRYKRLEEIRGFLCHLAMTYELVTPYLKGLHLTLAAHHPQRDTEGWKLSTKEWDLYLWGKASEGKFSGDEDNECKKTAQLASREEPTQPPTSVKPVARLSCDLEALAALFDEDTPSEVLLRAARVYSILYGFADASGTGFGSTILGEDGIAYRIGTWESDVDEDSSNFREFENVVCALEDEGKKGNLNDAIIFLCTDNSTVEAGLAKGNSTSRKLFELVLRVRRLQMKFRCTIIVTHVAGKRMEAQGTDGVSRGHLKEGVSTGADMLSFIPLHLSALQRSASLKGWLQSWLGTHAEFLEPDDWFERGHDFSGGAKDSQGFWRPRILPGTFVWSPPPAAADVALEELRKARLKRQDSLHVVVIPRLLKPEWFRQLYKTCDLVFDVPIGADCWPSNMFEPIVIGIVFPFLSRPPWQLRRTPKMFQVVRTMRKMWKIGDLAARDFLCQLLLEYAKLSSVPPNVVRKMLHFKHGREIPSQEKGSRRVRRSRGPEREGEVDSGMGKSP